jgi:hypothetical protein
MIRLRWNALRVGHHVLVHDEDSHDMPLVPGRVAMIQTALDSNDIEIRIAPATGPSTVVRPRRLAVHLERLDPTERCRRCATNVNTTATTASARVTRGSSSADRVVRTFQS